jgi:acyl-CoA thioesterase
MRNSENSHPFDVATRLDGGPDRFIGHTSKHYDNMVGPFGGIIAAVILRAALDHPERQGDPLALTVNFSAPVTEGAFEVLAKAVRTNRSTQHWCMELSQQGLAVSTATAVFATRRETWSSTELQFPRAAGSESCEAVSLAGFPSWVGRYEFRFLKGGIPPMINIENEEAFVHSESLQWVRDEPGRPLDHLSLAAICDSFFPRIYIRRNRFVPAGTVSLTVYFHADAEEIAKVGGRAVLCRARANRFHHNYFDQAAEVWSPEGALLATSSQVVYYKE